MAAPGTVLAACFACGIAQAQALIDPTQPPSAYAPKVTGAPSDAAAREQRLQAVIRGPGERRSAVIGGQKVRVGDEIITDGGPARVTAIFDDRVVLTRGTARETLELLPQVTSAASTGNPTARK